MKFRVAILSALALVAACGEQPTQPKIADESDVSVISSSANATTLYISDASVTAWGPIYQYYGSGWGSNPCSVNNALSLSDPRWGTGHAATQFATGTHPWESSVGYFGPWINAWGNISSGGGPGFPGTGVNPAGHNWTKYEKQVTGNGTFSLKLLADNCSWIYIDGTLVGYQDDAGMPQTIAYGVTLNGTHTLTFVIFDGGGAAGGMFRLETTTTPPPPLNPDLDGDGHPNTSDDFPLDPLRFDADNLLYNGSFERPVIPGVNPPWQTFTSSGQGLTSWNIVSGDVETQSGEVGWDFPNTPDGNQVLDLNSAAISQQVGTQANFKYRVNFSLSQNYVCTTSASVNVTFGSTTQSFTFTPGAGENFKNMRWDAHSFEGISTGTSSTLQITATGWGGCGGAMLDAVSVQEVGPADLTPPVIVPTVTGTLGTNGWYTSNVNVSWSVTDAESAISGSSGCGATSVTSNTAGVTFLCKATSAGGTASESVTIKRDAMAPSVAPTITGTLGANGWYTSNVNVSWVVGGGLSGIASSSGCGLTVTTTDNPGTNYTCTATSGAGLSTTQTVSAKRDASAPSVTPTISGTLGAGGWYTSDVTVSWATADATSGASACASTTTTTDNSGTTYSCTSTNGAGLSTTVSVSAKRDATQPAIGYSGNAGAYTVDQTVAITCAASDAMSGLASNTCADINGAAYTFAIGANSYSASAKDNAGNTNTATANFTVTVTGDGLCALVQRFVTQQGVANSLCVKIRQQSWGAFRNEVRAQGGKKFLSEAHAAILLSLVNHLG